MFSTIKSAKPQNPFMYYSAFKLSIYFKNNLHKCVPLHSQDCKHTLAQLQHRKIEAVVFDRLHGYEWCIEKCKSMYDKIHVALLFSAYDSSILYAKFTGGKWYRYQEPEINDLNRYVKSKNYAINANGFVIINDLPQNELSKRY